MKQCDFDHASRGHVEIESRRSVFGTFRLQRTLARHLCGRIFFFLQSLRLWLVHAERLFVEIVACSSIGACAASHANVAELAAAAFSFEIVRVAQFVEHDRVFPDLGERLLSEIARQGRQISAGVDFALMRDETDRCASKASFGHGIHVGRMRSRMSNWMTVSLRLQFDAG